MRYGTGDSAQIRKIQKPASLVFWIAFLGLLIPQLAAAQTARLRVDITPAAAVQAGAYWRVDGGPWQVSGATVSNLSSHRAQITFSPIAGWNTPDPVQIWTFSGLERAATATYVPVPRYAIGEIPPFLAYEGKPLSFQVYSREKGSAAQLSAAAVAPAPSGPMSGNLGTSVGLFTYTAAPADRKSFAVIFTANAAGETMPTTQSVTFSPIPNLPTEQTVFSLKTGLTIPGLTGDDRPQVTEESVSASGVFNCKPLTTRRKITILGEEVVFDPTDPDPINGLFNRFNYQDSPQKNADIQELTINASRVIIRGPLRLAGTKVTINALDLRFEDVNVAAASLTTTPVNHTERAADAQYGTWDDKTGVYSTPRIEASPGADGEPGGDVFLNIGSFYESAGNTRRLILAGARGQDGGNGLYGRNGYSPTTYWTGISDYTVPNMEVCTWYQMTDWTPPVPWPIITSEGDQTWPGNGEDCYPPGKPGYGGAGGTLHSTVNFDTVQGYSWENHHGQADLAGALMGTIDFTKLNAWRLYGGAAFIACHHLWLQSLYGVNVSVVTEERRDPQRGGNWNENYEVSWVGDAANQKKAADGSLVLEQFSPSFLMQPEWIRLMLDRGKAEYLYGDVDKAEVRLSESAEMLEVLEAQWTPGVALDETQMNMRSMRSEMIEILHRIHSNLDYFGNPAGWAPMLSFEVTAAAFQQEADHAINLMYLAYWTRNTGYSLQRRITGLQKMWQDLGDEVASLQKEYDDLRARIPELNGRAEAIKSEISEQNRQMYLLTERMRAQAEKRAEGDAWRIGALAGTQLGLRLGAVIFEVCPVGQPALGAAGGMLDMTGKVDFNGMWDSAQKTYTNTEPMGTTTQLFTDKLPFLSDAVAGADGISTDGDRPEEENALSSGTMLLANGVKGVSKILGDFKVPMPDIEGEAAKLLAQSDEYTTITTKLLALAKEKMELMNTLEMATQDVLRIPNQILRDMLAMDAIQRQITKNEAVFSPDALQYISEIETRARERLLKYHYYMAKAYEYRLLKPYQGQLDLGPLVDKIVTMADTATAASLTSEQFESLKEPYLEQLSAVAETIFDQYATNPPELSAPIGFSLTGDQLARLNAGQPVTLNMMDMGLFPANEENVRLVDISVDDLQVHLKGGGSTRWATMDLYATHSGISNLKSRGEVYQFRHYNAMTENPLAWGIRYDHFATQKLTSLKPSAASDSLLRSLLPGTASQDMMLYSRPGAWADIVLTKDVNAENNVDIVLDSVRLKVQYDFTRRAASQSALKVTASQEGFMPFFGLNKTDLNARQDGRGSIYRTYSNTDLVSVEAPAQYGQYVFQKWTDAYGNDLVASGAAQMKTAGVSLAPANAQAAPPLVRASANQMGDGGRFLSAMRLASAPLTDRTINLALDDDLTVRAVYVSIPGALNVTLAPAAAVTAGARWQRAGTLAWQDSGTTETLIPTGPYQVQFKPVAGWDLPASQAVTVRSEQTTQTTAVYVRQKGTVVVAVTPNTAPWSFTDGDGLVHNGTGGQTVADLPTGSSTLTWGALANYDAPTPNPAIQSLAKDATVQFGGTYTRQTGTVQIQATPKTASWSFTDGEGQVHTGTGDASLAGIPTGAVALTWNPLAGYDLPNPGNQNLAKGATIPFSETYTRQTGTVTVDPTPGAASWTLTDSEGHATNGSGRSILNSVPTGNIQVTWGALAGYDPPAAAAATLAQGGSQTLAGAYRRQVGQVKIDATPDAAAWTLTDGNGAVHNGTGDAVLNALPTGPVTLRWADLANYDAPAPNPQTQTLAKDATVNFAGLYSGQLGNVSVRVSPESASWTLRDSRQADHSGAGNQTLSGIPVGALQLTWGVPAGYDPPAKNPATATLTKVTVASFFEILVPSASGPERTQSLIQRYLLGLSTDPSGLDTNGDQKVTIADLVRSNVDAQPPTAPATPSPADKVTMVSVTTNLDWADCTRGKTYDVYLWKGSTKPATASKAGLTTSLYDPPTSLTYATQYSWQVVAKNGTVQTAGPIWSFTTRPQPVQLISPNTNQIWTRGAKVQIHWKLDKSLAGTSVRFDLWRNNVRVKEVGRASSATGEATSTVAVPSITAATGYKLRVVSLLLEARKTGEAWDQSDGSITIK